MLGVRCVCLAMLIAAGATGSAGAQQKAPQSDWGLQGSLGIGGGDKLGFGGFATLGPRFKANLFSIRGTVGQGAKQDSTQTRDPVWEVGLTYGRRGCSPGACYGFALGPGVVGLAVHDSATGTMVRTTTGALLWQVSLQGVISPTTSIGLTFIGNRNSKQNFWGLMLGMQFGMPWHGGSPDDEE